jgi:hypothetical protein
VEENRAMAKKGKEREAVKKNMDKTAHLIWEIKTLIRQKRNLVFITLNPAHINDSFYAILKWIKQKKDGSLWVQYQRRRFGIEEKSIFYIESVRLVESIELVEINSELERKIDEMRKKVREFTNLL